MLTIRRIKHLVGRGENENSAKEDPKIPRLGPQLDRSDEEKKTMAQKKQSKIRRE